MSEVSLLYGKSITIPSQSYLLRIQQISVAANLNAYMKSATLTRRFGGQIINHTRHSVDLICDPQADLLNELFRRVPEVGSHEISSLHSPKRYLERVSIFAGRFMYDLKDKLTTCAQIRLSPATPTALTGNTAAKLCEISR